MNRAAMFTIGALLAATSLALGAEAGKTTKSKTLATVSGAAITEADVMQQVQGELQKLEEQRQQLLAQALEGMINNKLVELEAKRRSIAPEALVKELDTKITPPTQQEIDAFYEQNKARIAQPKEQIAPQIRDYLLSQRRQAVQEELLKTLRAKYSVRNVLAEEQTARELAQAKEVRALIETADAASRGSAQAPVTIVEFSDFECPACGQFEPTLQKAVVAYGDRVRLVYRQFPLSSLHPHAQKAAEAALCAADQGKFWELHDLMFKEQQQLAEADLKEKAKRLGLDAERFASCVASGEKLPLVSRDVEIGSQAGVNWTTPTVFINGRKLSGAASYEQLTALIEEEIARQKPAASGT